MLSLLNINIVSKKDQISIAGLHGDENIQIYSLTGMCLYQSKATSTEKVIPFHQNGIFIIRIQNNNSTFAGKIIKWISSDLKSRNQRIFGIRNFKITLYRYFNAGCVCSIYKTKYNNKLSDNGI